MTDAQKPLIINKWQKAMADSEHLGHALMLKADIESFPGAVKVKNKMLSMAILITQQTFTNNTGTGVCTAAGDLRTQAEIDAGNTYLSAPVYFTSTGSVPTGLSINTVYFLIYVSNTTFKIATSVANAKAGTFITPSDVGSGVLTVNPVPMGTINYMVKDPRTNYIFAIDNNGRVWNTQGGNVLQLLYNSGLDTGSAPIANAGGNGIVLFRVSDGSGTFLFAFRNAVIDVINVFGNTQIDSPNWTNSWNSTTLNAGASSGEPHYSIVAQDNIIYFTDDRYVGRIVELPTKVFSPSDNTTYENPVNTKALTLPQAEIANWLEELSGNLLIAGLTFNKIYPWNKTDLLSGPPILCPENHIYRLKTMGYLTYILAGTKGNIYYTQGSYCKFFKKVPYYAINNTFNTSSNPIAWGGVGSGTGTLLAGIGVTNTGNSGVYKVYSDGRIVLDQQPYAGNLNPTAILANDDFYYIGYAGGADYTTINQYSNYDTILQSELSLVADKTRKATFSQVELQLAKPVLSGPSHCRISYRTDSLSNWTVLASYTLTATDTSFNTDIGLVNIENIQIQAELDGNIELAEIRLYP